MNKVFLSGHLTRDVEVRNSQSGKAFARAGIAVNRPFKKEEVDFFNLVAFGKTAEFLGKYFRKGSKVLLEGSLQTSSYEKNGVKVNAVDVIVDAVEFADSKGQKGKGNDRADDWAGEPVPDDDTPF